MDRSALVTILRDLFRDNERTEETNSFVLGVSAPGIVGRDCHEKADNIIRILFAQTTVEVRRMINRVRVYDSIDELESHAVSDFERRGCEGGGRSVNLKAQTYEVV
jgi:hypothetical protein